MNTYDSPEQRWAVAANIDAARAPTSKREFSRKSYAPCRSALVWNTSKIRAPGRAAAAAAIRTARRTRRLSPRSAEPNSSLPQARSSLSIARKRFAQGQNSLPHARSDQWSALVGEGPGVRVAGEAPASG